MSFSTNSTTTPLLSLSCNNLLDFPQLDHFEQQQQQKDGNIVDLQIMWTAFNKCKSYIENGPRLEYMSWRLWHYRRSHPIQQNPSDNNMMIVLPPTEATDVAATATAAANVIHDAYTISHEVSQKLQQKCHSYTIQQKQHQLYHASINNKQQITPLLPLEEQEPPPADSNLLSRSSSFCQINMPDTAVVPMSPSMTNSTVTTTTTTTTQAIAEAFKESIPVEIYDEKKKKNDQQHHRQNTPSLTTSVSYSSSITNINSASTLNDQVVETQHEATTSALLSQQQQQQQQQQQHEKKLLVDNKKEHHFQKEEEEEEEDDDDDEEEEDDDDEDYYLSDEDLYEEDDDLYEDEETDINYDFVQDFKKTKPRPATPQRSLLSDLLQRSCTSFAAPSSLSNSSSSFTTNNTTSSSLTENDAAVTQQQQLTTNNINRKIINGPSLVEQQQQQEGWQESSFHGW